MLSELKEISEKMDEMGLKKDTLHPYIVSAPGGKKVPKIKVNLKEDGDFSVEIIDEASWAEAFYIYQNAHNQYPISKVQLSKIMGIKDINAFIENKTLIDIPLKKVMKNVFRGNEIEKSIIDNFDKSEEIESIYLLNKRMSNIKDYKIFCDNILREVMKLFPEKSEEKGGITKKDAIASMYLMFSADDCQIKGIKPICHPSTMRFISKKYYELYEEGNGDLKEDCKKDIFGDPFEESAAHNFPQLVVSKIKFYLYSQNKYSPCFSSYGVNGGDACPLSQKSRRHIIKNIQHLLSSDNKDIYWHIFENKSKKNGENKIVSRDIILVFSTIDKNDLKNLEELFMMATGRDNVIEELQDDSEEKIKIKSQKIIMKIKGEMSEKTDENIFLLSFRVPTNGPSKLLMSEMMSVKTLIEMGERWQKGFDNFENSTIKIKKKKEENSILTPMKSHITLNQMKNVINKKWNRSAKTNKGKTVEFDFVSINDMFNLFMGDKNIREKIIKLLSANHIHLMIDIVNKIQNNKAYDILQDRRDIFYLPVLFSEILYLNGIEKNDYVKNPAYILGKTFASINNLQRSYYILNKQDKDIQELAGSKYVHLALNNPVKAFNILMKRSMNFLVRSKAINNIEYIGKIDKSLFYFPIANSLKELRDTGVPSKFLPVDKMLFAFGYFQNRYFQNNKNIGENNE